MGSCDLRELPSNLHKICFGFLLKIYLGNRQRHMFVHAVLFSTYILKKYLLITVKWNDYCQYLFDIVLSLFYNSDFSSGFYQCVISL